MSAQRNIPSTYLKYEETDTNKRTNIHDENDPGDIPFFRRRTSFFKSTNSLTPLVQSSTLKVVSHRWHDPILRVNFFSIMCFLSFLQGDARTILCFFTAQHFCDIMFMFVFYPCHYWSFCVPLTCWSTYVFVWFSAAFCFADDIY